MINLYRKQNVSNLLVLGFAVLIGSGSIWYTNNLVNRLLAQEQQQTSIFAEVQEYLANAVALDEDVNSLMNIISTNYYIPVVLADSAGNPQFKRNLPIPRSAPDSLAYLRAEIEEMKLLHPPIELNLQGTKSYIYFGESQLVSQLRYFPFVQLTVIFLFFLFVYLLFTSSRRAEQNKVWVGLAKETAHQLGTPLSSLVAWLEYFRADEDFDQEIVEELAKDVQRLDMITARFSSIGSPPALKPENLVVVVTEIVDYLQKRLSSKVAITIHAPDEPLEVPMNRPLFEWVIENLCKNAVDAMSGVGRLDLVIQPGKDDRSVQLDVKDTGKGIPPGMFKQVFKPGFTTKKRGWGLGLTLVKRIVENYHRGRIFVLESKIDVGTTFRVTLPTGGSF
jgi:signal transduction histidine kinase